LLVIPDTTDGKFQFYLGVRMSHLDQKQGWRQRLGWLTGELLVVFAGMSAAFVVENYRDNRKQIAEMHQAVAGMITELTSTETKARTYSDAIWQTSLAGRMLIVAASALFPVTTGFLARNIRHQRHGIALLHLA
jgi:hypothetical protein